MGIPLFGDRPCSAALAGPEFHISGFLAIQKARKMDLWVHLGVTLLFRCLPIARRGIRTN